MNLEEIIRWSFGQWAQQNEKGKDETKIIIDVNKINQIFPENHKKKEESQEEKLIKKIDELEE
ncbi:MAG: hypothetical protein mread185_000414 [Mycoplasmataceae bacterium]|nr:MAG: hypothetical protein mread185_000414 [Mycoplasmataceae bacterium]